MAYGGRGGGKSHAFANLVLLRCLQERTRVVCIREVQNSIKESVKQLITDKIVQNKLEEVFDVLDTEIRGANGSLIIFKGMQSYNAANIKSLEGYDVCWVEEASNISHLSWRLLRPTIRKPGSEIWVSYNPVFDTDAVDAFFRGPHPPNDATIIEINWNDNPFFTDAMRDEMQRDFAADPEMAEHVWNGGYQVISEGAYYARDIALAEKEGRIAPVDYDPQFPVYSSWDIGVDDYTSVWLWQEYDQRVYVLDFYEVSGDGAQQVVEAFLPELNPDIDAAAAQLIVLGRKKPFEYGRHFLPHDVKNREWGSGARSRIEILMALGVKPIKRGVSQDPADRIAATRRLLPHVVFNRSERVEKGLRHLRRYSRKWNETLGSYTTPLHDEHSHAADAFGEFAMNCAISKPKTDKRDVPKELAWEATDGGRRIKSNMSISDYLKKKEREAQW